MTDHFDMPNAGDPHDPRNYQIVRAHDPHGGWGYIITDGEWNDRELHPRFYSSYTAAEEALDEMIREDIAARKAEEDA